MKLREFEMPWRTNYEAIAFTGWVVCAAASYYIWMSSDMPTRVLEIILVFSALFAAVAGWQAMQIWSYALSLCGIGIEFISDELLFAKMKRKKNSFWMGWGYDWTPVHSQRLYQIKRADPESLYPPRLIVHLYQLWLGRKVASLQKEYVGLPWIHGLEPQERDIYVQVDHFIGNTLILGTTRCGKTRALELIAEMAIASGYTVISIDPKGDKEYEKSLRAACKACGRMNDYAVLSLATPSESIRIDPLANFTHPSDLASRVSALVGGDESNTSFRDFAWGALNSIILGMVEMGEKPTLVKIRSYIDNGIAGLLLRVVLQFFDSKLPTGWEDDVAEFAKANKQGRRNQDEGEVQVRQSLNALLNYYVHLQSANPDLRNEAIESLSDMFKHDAAHFGKMIANLVPILAMLTTGEMGPLLSPDPRDIEDPRPMSNLASLVRSNSVVYIGLNALANKALASMTGSILLSDATSVAANIYNYDPNDGPRKKIFLIVDEAVEVINEPYIQLLNKAAGAGVVNIAAAQTVPDFSARFGSEDKAMQMLGNFNNLIALRVKDKKTQEFVVETFGETYIQSKASTYTSATSSKTNVAHFTGSKQEKISETLEAMIPSDITGQMPNWQAIALFSGGRIVKIRLPIIKHGD